MSWLLGYANPSIAIRVDDRGVVFGNDVAVTEEAGWMTLSMPATALARGAPELAAVRIRLSQDEHGAAMLWLEQIELGGRRHQGLHALLLTEGGAWAAALPVAVHAAIARAGVGARAAAPMAIHAAEQRERTATRPLRAVRASMASRSPEETWDGRAQARADAPCAAAMAMPR